MDPLTALREFTIHGELDRVTQSGGEFHFGSDYSFPCGAATAFRSKSGGYYALDTLLFFLRHHKLKHTDYLQSARHHQLPTITLPDRKPLLDYLFGLTSTSASVDRTVSFSQPSQPFDEYRPEEVGHDPAEVPASQVLDTADYVSMIRALERPLKDREACVEVENVRSQRVVEKAGFAKEGVLRSYKLIQGEGRDMIMYSFLRTDSYINFLAPHSKVERRGKRTEGIPQIFTPQIGGKGVKYSKFLKFEFFSLPFSPSYYRVMEQDTNNYFSPPLPSRLIPSPPAESSGAHPKDLTLEYPNGRFESSDVIYISKSRYSQIFIFFEYIFCLLFYW